MGLRGPPWCSSLGPCPFPGWSVAFVLLGIRYVSCHRLVSWDRFALPLPFSRVELTLAREPMAAEGESDEAVAARLQVRLRALSGDLA